MSANAVGNWATHREIASAIKYATRRNCVRPRIAQLLPDGPAPASSFAYLFDFVQVGVQGLGFCLSLLVYCFMEGWGGRGAPKRS